MSNEIVPLNHLVIIPDGNRRWAKNSGVPAWEGHRRGANNLDMILQVCKEKEIHFLTMWGFSTENWKRDQEEVKFLMELFFQLLDSKKNDLIKYEIHFTHLGRKDRLPENLKKKIVEVEEATAHFTQWNYQVALDYGGRNEITRAVNSIVADAKSGKLAEEITEEKIKEYLDTTLRIPDPDLILRTSGEKRLSGIMPYQSVYAELEFLDKKFPEMTKEDLESIIEGYYNRQRRFGGS